MDSVLWALRHVLWLTQLQFFILFKNSDSECSLKKLDFTWPSSIFFFLKYLSLLLSTKPSRLFLYFNKRLELMALFFFHKKPHWLHFMRSPFQQGCKFLAKEEAAIMSTKVLAAAREIGKCDARAWWRQFSHGEQSVSQSAFLQFSNRVVLAIDIPLGNWTWRRERG